MRRLFLAVLATLSLVAISPVPAEAASGAPKVAIIVGPVGSLTATYLHLAELAAAEAERNGATVSRAYSPHATPANVLAAVDGANVVIYFGHGYGHPSPYGGLDTARQNGWGLQGPRARGTHGDGLNGELTYYGEDWIVANARPAPGFVMIYSNVCYAPGASEGGFAAATESDALMRVAHYSRKVFRMGGSAYYAIDFDRGAADVVGRILRAPRTAYGTIFASDHRYEPSALRAYAHPLSAGQQVWLHRTKYTDGPPNYWYAFAGNPDAVPSRSWDPVAPRAELASPSDDLAPTGRIVVAVSEPVTGLVDGSWRLTDADGAAVALTISTDAATNEVALLPDPELALSAHYRLELATGASDAAGNPLPAVSWDLATRLDADPVTRAFPVVLQPGEHRLVRFDASGRVTEEQTVETVHPEWPTAAARVRMPGQPGRWLELANGRFAGWWVAESPAAHAPGLMDAARFDAGATVKLPGGRHPIYRFAAGGVLPGGEFSLREERDIAVDRRIVADGRLLVRAAAGETTVGGRWIAIDPDGAPVESFASRILADDELETDASMTLGLGAWTLFEFDDRGVAVGRRDVLGRAEGEHLVIRRTLDVAGVRFFVVSGGELDGWAVRDDDRHTISTALEEASAE